jgi:predicted  nucleic acid-binding Zn-ribbon protein
VTDLETLVQLQAIDQEIAQKSRRLGEVRATLGESEEVRAARTALEAARGRLHDLEQRQRALEWDVDDRANRIRELDAKLYSGTIKNPKELAGLQTEIEHLRTALSDAEGNALQVMGDVDEKRSEVGRLERGLADLEAQWGSGQEHLRDEKKELEGALSALNTRRQAPAAAVPQPLLVQYDQIRKRRGTAVARIDRNMCLGCRTTLPTSQIQNARQGKIITCSECGRMLYLGR